MPNSIATIPLSLCSTRSAGIRSVASYSRTGTAASRSSGDKPVPTSVSGESTWEPGRRFPQRTWNVSASQGLAKVSWRRRLRATRQAPSSAGTVEGARRTALWPHRIASQHSESRLKVTALLVATKAFPCHGNTRNSPDDRSRDPASLTERIRAEPANVPFGARVVDVRLVWCVCAGAKAKDCVTLAFHIYTSRERILGRCGSTATSHRSAPNSTLRTVHRLSYWKGMPRLPTRLRVERMSMLGAVAALHRPAAEARVGMPRATGGRRLAVMPAVMPREQAVAIVPRLGGVVVSRETEAPSSTSQLCTPSTACWSPTRKPTELSTGLFKVVFHVKQQHECKSPSVPTTNHMAVLPRTVWTSTPGPSIHKVIHRPIHLCHRQPDSVRFSWWLTPLRPCPRSRRGPRSRLKAPSP